MRGNSTLAWRDGIPVKSCRALITRAALSTRGAQKANSYQLKHD
jgi:hypothetical protein